MCYQNGKKILPPPLLSAIQEYIDGEYIYIPRIPSSAASGLDVAMKVLKKVDGISFCELTSKDVVRHPLVQKIVQAYEEYEKKAVQKKTDRTVKSKTKTSTGTTRRKS